MDSGSPPTGVALRASNLTTGYAGHPVLRDISFEVKAGELAAIVGPNGAGKSTLLKAIGGSLTPWTGEVELIGRPLKDYDRRILARTLAIVPQENLVAFRFTALEIVLMGRAPHLGPFHLETRHDLEIASQALNRFGLRELVRRPIQELSGGERKRVFLARALAQEPRIALLDEPAAFLDMRHIAEIFERFRELCVERAMTVIVTLHDLNAAAHYADRVLLMKNGRTVAWGTPEEVLTAGNLRDVYETPLYVGRNPATGAIAVLPGNGHEPAV
jgi:iron complex transport system ATP-binding protein